MSVRPQIATASVVLVGNFNPLIFRPDWFAQKEILATDAISDAIQNKTIKIVHPEIVEFQASSFRISVERAKFQAMTLSEPLVAIFDLVDSTFCELPETPVSALGINRDSHYPLGSPEKWHALGDMLAPKDHWNPLFQDTNGVRTGGLRTLVVERSQRQDGRAGHIQVRVEPSTQIENAVFIAVNDHYTLGPTAEPIRAEEAIKVFREIFENSMRYSLELMKHIVSLGDA